MNTFGHKMAAEGCSLMAKRVDMSYPTQVFCNLRFILSDLKDVRKHLKTLVTGISYP